MLVIAARYFCVAMMQRPNGCKSRSTWSLILGTRASQSQHYLVILKELWEVKSEKCLLRYKYVLHCKQKGKNANVCLQISGCCWVCFTLCFKQRTFSNQPEPLQHCSCAPWHVDFFLDCNLFCCLLKHLAIDTSNLAANLHFPGKKVLQRLLKCLNPWPQYSPKVAKPRGK